MNQPNPRKTQEIGRMLLTIGLAAAGASIPFLMQFGGMEERLKAVELHMTDNPHPPYDYRHLMDERVKNLNERFNRHEQYFNHPHEVK